MKKIEIPNYKDLKVGDWMCSIKINEDSKKFYYQVKSKTKKDFYIQSNNFYEEKDTDELKDTGGGSINLGNISDGDRWVDFKLNEEEIAELKLRIAVAGI